MGFDRWRRVTPRRQRPVPYLLGQDGPSVELPYWAAAWLERNTDLPQRRLEARGADPGIDDVLAKIRYAASHDPSLGSVSGSVDGTSLDVEPEHPGELGVFLEVAEVAALLNIGGRAVRKAITEDRLPARRVGGRWLINRIDADNYTTRRNAA